MAARIIRFKYSIQTLNSVHNLQHLLLYSTKSPNQSYCNYFVDNLGFSPQQAHSASTKLRIKNGNYSKFSDNANSVVDFLKQHGFDDTHIKKVVSSHPNVLASKVDKTLKPKFKVLQDHGFSGSNLVSAISSSPLFVKIHMDHIIHDLRAILGSNDNLLRFFRKTKLLMGPSALGNLNSNIALLNNDYGVDIQVIRKDILNQPKTYLRDTKIFQNLLVRVEEELRIPRISGMFLSGVHLLGNLSKTAIESKRQLLKSYGWTQYDVSELMRTLPVIFRISEKNFTKKLGFLMTELGYKPDYLATHPALLGYSLETRMVPRHRVLLVLKEKCLLDYNFYTAISQTETRFQKILIEPFKEDVPDLLQLYQSNKGCSNIDAISRRGGAKPSVS